MRAREIRAAGGVGPGKPEHRVVVEATGGSRQRALDDRAGRGWAGRAGGRRDDRRAGRGCGRRLAAIDDSPERVELRFCIRKRSRAGRGIEAGGAERVDLARRPRHPVVLHLAGLRWTRLAGVLRCIVGELPGGQLDPALDDAGRRLGQRLRNRILAFLVVRLQRGRVALIVPAEGGPRRTVDGGVGAVVELAFDGSEDGRPRRGIQARRAEGVDLAGGSRGLVVLRLARLHRIGGFAGVLGGVVGELPVRPLEVAAEDAHQRLGGRLRHGVLALRRVLVQREAAGFVSAEGVARRGEGRSGAKRRGQHESENGASCHGISLRDGARSLARRGGAVKRIFARNSAGRPRIEPA